MIAAPSQARLWETLVECNKRYGEPIVVRRKNGEQFRSYERAGYRIDTVSSRNRVVEIYYARIDGGLLSSKERKLFLYVNSGSSKWFKVNQLAEWKKVNRGREADESLQKSLMWDLANFYVWARADGQVEASYDREEGVLFLSDAQRLAAEKAKASKKARAPENPHGF